MESHRGGLAKQVISSCCPDLSSLGTQELLTAPFPISFATPPSLCYKPTGWLPFPLSWRNRHAKIPA